MREIDRLYNEAEMLANKLASYTLQDLRELKDAERDALTEAYDLLVQTLTCLSDASRFRKEEEPYVVSAAKIHNEYYTSQQKGEEVPEGTPIDNSNHTYFTGDERKFNWDIIYAMKKITNSNTIDYDAFVVSYVGDGTIILKNKGRAPE